MGNPPERLAERTQGRKLRRWLLGKDGWRKIFFHKQLDLNTLLIGGEADLRRYSCKNQESVWRLVVFAFLQLGP